MLDFYLCVWYGFVIGVIDGVVYDDGLVVFVVVIVQVCEILFYWCIGYVQWIFDGVWGVVGDIQCGVFGIYVYVQEVVQVQVW